MTFEQLLQSLGQDPKILLAVFVGIPAVALGLYLLHGKNGGTRYRYVYSVLVYLTCIPGVFATVLTAYTLLFLRASLLGVNMLVYFLPILSMAATLAIIRKSIHFDLIPGFNRIQGLMMLLGASFLIVFLLDRLRVWLVFRGSILALVALSLILFLVLKWGAHKISGRGKA